MKNERKLKSTFTKCEDNMKNVKDFDKNKIPKLNRSNYPITQDDIRKQNNTIIIDSFSPYLNTMIDNLQKPSRIYSSALNDEEWPNHFMNSFQNVSTGIPKRYMDIDLGLYDEIKSIKSFDLDNPDEDEPNEIADQFEEWDDL